MASSLLLHACRRLLAAVPVLFGVTVVTFLLVHITPGDPARTILGPTASQTDVQRLHEKLGLDRPLLSQYWHYLNGLLHGDLGQSVAFQQPVSSLVLERLPVTLVLALGSFILAVAVSIPFGVLAARYRGRSPDVLTRVMALLGVSAPSFWVGIMLIYLFAFKVRLFPAAGLQTLYAWSAVPYFVLPCVTLALAQVALSTRTLRASLLEVIGKDYMRTAESKGLRDIRVLFVHGLRNAFIPVMTVMGLQIAGLFGGAVVTETVFALPGIGRLSVDAIQNGDMPLVQGIVLLSAVAVVVINLLTDVLYRVVNPRMTHA